MAGEISGDLLAGLLLDGLRERWPAMSASGGARSLREKALRDLRTLRARGTKPSAGPDEHFLPGNWNIGLTCILSLAGETAVYSRTLASKADTASSSTA